MSARRAFSNAPVMLTHWDPEMYPSRPIPPLAEIVINLLAYGHVVLKDVDLFMNETIVSHLSEKRHSETALGQNWEVLASLMRTGRITVLTADPARGLNPDTPFLSAATDHYQNRTYAGVRWQHFDDQRRHFCSQLDALCVPLGVCKSRHSPPSGRNTFAELLRDVLTNSNTEWRERPQFAGIRDATAAQFAEFCEYPDRSLRFLEQKGQNDIIGRDQGFYRSRLYQCAQYFEPTETAALCNLAQSVYFDRECHRENTAGTYFGKLAECPNPYVPIEEGSFIDVRVVPKHQKRAISVFYTPDIGDVINETLENCGSVMRTFWTIGAASDSPEERFRLAWTHVAEEYARNSKRYTLARNRAAIRHRWERITRPIHCILFVYEAGLFGFKLILGAYPSLELEHFLHSAEALQPGAIALATTVLGETAENWVRSGLADTRLVPTCRNVVLESASTRAGSVPPPIGPT